uniref:ACT domain-containing protein n=1 Tax=Micrurus spixii TaxID=129469 RepID=A0A2D4MBZ7_9SAUR
MLIYQKAIVRDGQRETIRRILILDPIKSIKQAMKCVLLKGKTVCFIFSPCFRVAVAVSSGNMEFPLMRQCMDQALTLDNRVCKFTVTVTDCPGEISKLLETLAREEARILNIKQEQPYMRTDLFTSEVSCVVETRDRSHTTQLRKILTDRYPMITWVER